MSRYTPSDLYSRLAAVDLTDKIGFAVMNSTTGGDPVGSVRLCSDGTRFAGVVLYGARVHNDASSVPAVQSAGRTATIQAGGIVRAIAAGVIGQGARVSVNTADGRFKAAATGEIVVGTALTAGVAGKSFELELSPVAGAAMP